MCPSFWALQLKHTVIARSLVRCVKLGRCNRALGLEKAVLLNVASGRESGFTVFLPTNLVLGLERPPENFAPGGVVIEITSAAPLRTDDAAQTTVMAVYGAFPISLPGALDAAPGYRRGQCRPPGLAE